MTIISFNGGCREVGRSAVLVDSIILDYGLKPSDPPEYPINGIAPKSVIISHGHLDHVGVAPNLMYYNPDVFMTPPTREISHILLKDSMNIMDNPPYGKREFIQFESSITEVDYNDPFEVDGWEITFLNAGHIPGSASIHLSRDINILYTGDIKLEDTRLLVKADMDFPETDILIVESTYFGTEHPERKKLEEKFVESIIDTLDRGGHAIVPAFAVGRSQEVLMILDKYGISPYLDGMGKEVSRIIERYPSYIRNAKKLRRAIKNAITVERGKREKILEEPSVVVTTAGMLNGGPALFYISRLYNDDKSKIILTGYQVEGTNGDLALNRGVINLGHRMVKLKMGVEQYDFSAHAGDSQLKEFVRLSADKGVEIVFTVHGENTEDFANWIRDEIGIDAFAPSNGEVYVTD
ncbi:putative exonuclease of the beta-lactamase fold involved in RNA processing [Archaeoglobus sulfaticallidus PM70-1]|uniref:Putative exonuclease of the beta-lactamase fold involved in RNA processing n=1 Tax=Archaeoglobus sulfaticallidus PM70-1 TaxID=387631 RepID=N0BJQ8_9EURY|nr:MBL fold metallo-hydrolase [Archaeoglobus sulfaticallidus]AGK60736.1 putative exonuclease of the beta-lactamase fold involved in RNA processing [Archaeoglobus sulfaticallidus PM70-1]